MQLHWPEKILSVYFQMKFQYTRETDCLFRITERAEGYTTFSGLAGNHRVDTFPTDKLSIY